MNKVLDKIRIIDRTQLSEEHYFLSLREQAHSKGLIDDSDIERMQYDCLNLLADKTERYNSGDSSSIRVEKAQDIMTSILFTIGLWLKTYPNPDDAVIALQKEPINEIYQKGRKRIDTMLMSTKALHAKLLHQLVDTRNVFYRSTIEGGIKGFFKLYYPDYSAHEIHITADYPLFNPVAHFKLAGIEFIKAYVEAAYYENQFCSYFSADDMHHLLCGYEEDYEELLINIYEPVMLTAIGCVIAGTDPCRLDITKEGTAFLQQLFSEIPKNEALKTIQKAAVELIHCFQCSNGLAQYIRNNLPLIAGKIEMAAKGHTLNRVFFIPAFPENNPKIIVSFGEKMDDEKYRKVIEEIGQYHSTQDKAATIKRCIHSLADLEDILLDADLSKEEMWVVLSELKLPQISALLKKYPLIGHMDRIGLREQEQFLRKSLHEFIHQLPQEQQEVIVKASAAIEEG